jgi:ketosteroid isomerase-like protein
MPNRPQGRAEQTRRTFIAAPIAVALAIGPAGSSALAVPAHIEIPADLGRAWDDYNRATIRKDVATLATLVTDDYILVNSDSSVQDKLSYLADFRVPGFKLDPYEIEQPIRKVWGNTALTGGIFNLGWVQDGKRQNRRLRIAHLWIKKGGRWRIAYTQLTRVPQ